MNVRWVRSNAALLAFLVVVMVAVGVLAVLVIRQQQDQATDTGRIYLQTAPAAGAASRKNTPDPANVFTKPDAPSPADTGEAVPGEVSAKDQASESADRPVKSDKPSREVSGEAVPGEVSAKDQASESRHRDPARAAG